MTLFDPRVAAIVGIGGAIVGSERVRHVVGRGAGYVAKGVMAVGAPVKHAGEDLVEEARHTATGNGHAKTVPAKSAGARTASAKPARTSA